MLCSLVVSITLLCRGNVRHTVVCFVCLSVIPSFTSVLRRMLKGELKLATQVKLDIISLLIDNAVVGGGIPVNDIHDFSK